MKSTDLWSALEASWPATSQASVGPFVWRDGAGGGSRVSAATLRGHANSAALDRIERKFSIEGRDPLFQVRPGDEAFDALLEERGYQILDPTIYLSAPLNTFDAPKADTGYCSWPPIAAQRGIWQDGGIGVDRINVMKRVQIPKTTLLARDHETPAGTAFIAALGSIAMLHALEIPQPLRRKGIAKSLMSHAATWAKDNGAATLAIVVTRANSGALALYSSLGMSQAGHYHYRRKGQS